MVEIKVAVVGTSLISKQFISAARRVLGVSVKAVYSRDKERGETFAKEHEIESVFSDINELAKSDIIDAVYIASPNSLHLKQSRLFLENNKHVICEKAIAEDADQLKELYNIADKNNLIFIEAYMALYLPQMDILKESISKVGRISTVKFDYCQLSSKYPLLLKGEIPNIFNPCMHTGSLMDIGIYCVYPAILLFGEPLGIEASCVWHQNGIDLCGSAIFDYGDKQAVLTYSKIGDSSCLCEIIGDKGSIFIKQISLIKSIVFKEKGGPEEVIFSTDEGHSQMEHEVRNFHKFITAREESKELYNIARSSSITVAKTLSKIRKICGINF